MAHISDQTRKTIKYDIVRHFAEEDEALHGLPIPSTTTSDGTTTTLLDTTLSRGTVDANRYDGRLIEITETTGGSTPVNEVAGVDNAGFASGTGTLTLSPALTVLPKAAMDYIPYPRNLSPDTVHEEISEILRNTEAPHLFIPSLVADSELVSLSTNWNTESSPTASIETGAADVFLGDNSFRFIAVDAGDGTISDSIAVTEGEVLIFSAFVRATTGSIVVSLFDVTNAVVIGSSSWSGRICSCASRIVNQSQS